MREIDGPVERCQVMRKLGNLPELNVKIIQTDKAIYFSLFRWPGCLHASAQAGDSSLDRYQVSQFLLHVLGEDWCSQDLDSLDPYDFYKRLDIFNPRIEYYIIIG